MINTFTSYQIITRDLERSIERIQHQPLVQRETEYYLENISKVKTIEEFVEDERLFNYAMKAHGLADMAYAKAFMVKVLEEGVRNEDSFANRLSDKRYVEFARTFDFEQYGEDATTFNPAREKTIELYGFAAIADGIPSDTQSEETAYYLENLPKVRSVDDLMEDARLLDFVLQAYDLEEIAGDEELIRNILESDFNDPESFVNQSGDDRYKSLAKNFNFAEHGAATTTFSEARQPSVDLYLRQTLEEDAGESNEGVRLALYFERKIPEISNWYEILGDPALAEVVRVALGLPDSFAQADIDKQVKFFESRLDLADFSDPEGLSRFMARFTSLWEFSNPSSQAASPILQLFNQPEFGISGDLLLTMARLKR